MVDDIEKFLDVPFVFLVRTIYLPFHTLPCEKESLKSKERTLISLICVLKTRTTSEQNFIQAEAFVIRI